MITETERKITTSMQEYETLLKNWRFFQKSKLTMENTFHCNVHLGLAWLPATLTFLAEKQFNSIEVCGIEEDFTIKIKSESVSGFTPNEKTIEIVMKPELRKRNVAVRFPTVAIRKAVGTKLRNWGGPTVETPSITASDSSTESEG